MATSHHFGEAVESISMLMRCEKEDRVDRERIEPFKRSTHIDDDDYMMKRLSEKNLYWSRKKKV